MASGWETGPLGDLYNPLYFNGGIAFHGAYSVPGYPASHGCVRIPMNAAEWFPTIVGNGWPVYVSGGVGDVIGAAQPEAAARAGGARSHHHPAVGPAPAVAAVTPAERRQADWPLDSCS